jgi:phosphopantetheinyl transferase
VEIGTSCLPAGTCHVWWAPRSAASERLAGVLGAEERARRLRYARSEDRDRYLVAHALARIVLGYLTATHPADLTFDALCVRCGGAHGKPRLHGGDLEFSISHSGERIALAVARGVPVGVNVERLVSGRDVDGLLASVLSDGESLGPDGADRAAALTAYWTRKEAVLKATGDGLSVSPAPSPSPRRTRRRPCCPGQADPKFTCTTCGQVPAMSPVWGRWRRSGSSNAMALPSSRVVRCRRGPHGAADATTRSRSPRGPHPPPLAPVYGSTSYPRPRRTPPNDTGSLISLIQRQR